tara:strand:- start:35 stop:238 length:204 start_codon:yes stop_codon:yes gene_type:complete
MTRKPYGHTRTTTDGAFQLGYTATPEEMCGTLTPWRPHWWAQYMGDGAGDIFYTYREALAWIREYRA